MRPKNSNILKQHVIPALRDARDILLAAPPGTTLDQLEGLLTDKRGTQSEMILLLDNCASILLMEIGGATAESLVCDRCGCSYSGITDPSSPLAAFLGFKTPGSLCGDERKPGQPCVGILREAK